MARVGAIILAAGESKRLGQPKQLIQFRGKTLIENAVNTAAEVCSSVAVVLGAHAATILSSVPRGAILVRNERWAEGMASSISAGLTEIQNDCDMVILMSCDQPLVTPGLLSKLISAPGLVASAYNGTLGIPAMFSKVFFPALLALTGTEGAKKIILQCRDIVTPISAPEAAFDVDTRWDVERLRTFE